MTDKVTFAPVTTFTNDTTAVTQTNANYVLMQNGLDNTISRDGTQPNQMNANLDMNGNRILNLASPGSANEPLRLADASFFASGSATFNTMPVGGTAGQVLTKNSSSNYDASWITTADPLFTSGTAGDVPASGGGTANFLRADATWASPVTNTIFVTASGDATGATDLANINSALTTAASNGYGIVVLKQGNYFINGSINMKANTHLIGNGAPGSGVDTVINMVAGTNVPGINCFLANGQLPGWSIERLAIVTPTTGTSAHAITIDSSLLYSIKDLIINVSGPSQIGLNFNPTQSSGGIGVGVGQGHIANIIIQVLAGATSGIGISLNANNNLGSPSLIGNTTTNTFINLDISLASNTQTGIYLGLCDTNYFYSTLISGTGSLTPTVINFDYTAHASANPGWPNANDFYGNDFGFGINWATPRIINTGTPGNTGAPNTFYGYGYGDGATAVLLANTEYYGEHVVLVTGSQARIGYTTSAGGAVNQSTSINTAVTLNTTCGQVNTISIAWTSGTAQSFTVNNNIIASTDTIIVNASSASGVFIPAVTGVTGGQFQVTLYPLASVTTGVTVNFSVIKAVNS